LPIWLTEPAMQLTSVEALLTLLVLRMLLKACHRTALHNKGMN
jgi:hypothetical protein